MSHETPPHSTHVRFRYLISRANRAKHTSRGIKKRDAGGGLSRCWDAGGRAAQQPGARTTVPRQRLSSSMSVPSPPPPTNGHAGAGGAGGAHAAPPPPSGEREVLLETVAQKVLDEHRQWVPPGSAERPRLNTKRAREESGSPGLRDEDEGCSAANGGAGVLDILATRAVEESRAVGLSDEVVTLQQCKVRRRQASADARCRRGRHPCTMRALPLLPCAVLHRACCE